MSDLKRFDGKLYYSAGWKSRKVDAEKLAEYIRGRSGLARVTRERDPGAGNRWGYQVWRRGGY